MYKYLVQFIISGFIFIFSMIFAWYEGSEIIENSTQWEYSTPFTKLFGVTILEGKDIIWLDYFVYSVKFQPTFPILMLLSAVYMTLLIIIYISKFNNKLSNIFWVLMVISLLFLSVFFIGASTFGGKLFFILTLCSASLFILVKIIQYKKKNANITN